MKGEHEAASLSTLKAIAKAMGVDMAITFPESIDDVEAIREKQARAKAERLVRMAQATAGLESQGVSKTALQTAIRRTTAELLVGPKRNLWTD